MQADWRKASGTQYIETKAISNWIVICSNENRKLVERFTTTMMTMARKKGMTFANPPIVMAYNGPRGWPELFESCIRGNVEFIM